jgi:hypothetical protein
MAETVKFIRAATMAAFEANQSTISNNSIVFIENEQKIWSNGVFYDRSSIDSVELQKIYDAIDDKQDAGNYITEEELLEKNYTVTKVFENITVSNWSEDSTYYEYPYVSIIAIDYVLNTDLGAVCFNVDEALSGNYAPVCETIDKGIKIWSKVNN